MVRSGDVGGVVVIQVQPAVDAARQHVSIDTLDGQPQTAPPLRLVSDSGNFRVQVFDGAGKFITVPSTDASNGIQLDSGPNGNSYITVQDCVFRNGLYCSIGGYADHFTVRDSTFGNVKSGINLQGGGGNLIVENSEFGVVAQAAGSDTYAIICGPPIMIKFTQPVLDKLGYAHDKIIMSLENRMKCGIGMCGRCNIGKEFVCKDGPVFTLEQLNQTPREY